MSRPLALRLGSRKESQQGFARLFWTAGCAAYLAHVAFAFHFHHGWSHAAAYDATARGTAESFGREWGGGLYFNYAFTLVWVGDVIWWWCGLRAYARRPLWMDLLIQTYLAFIAINGAIIFASGPTRWLGIAACLLLAVLAWRRT